MSRVNEMEAINPDAAAGEPVLLDQRAVLMSSRLALRDFSMVIALGCIWAYFAYATQMGFVGAENLSHLAVEFSITAVLALGALLVIVGGQIDLSVGSGVGLMGGIAAVLITWCHWNAGLAMLTATAIAVVIWVLMGALIVTQRIPAFIITLAGMLIFRGLQWKVIQGQTVAVAPGGQQNMMSILTTWYLPAAWGWVLAAVVIGALAYGSWSGRQRRRQFGFALEDGQVALSKFFVLAQVVVVVTLVCNGFRGIPLAALILAATALAVWVLTKHTRFGRYVYAIGSNEEAALVSGVPVRKVLIATFGIMGLIVALGGFMATASLASTTTTMGEQLELDAIAACVIGGTSLRGGRGTVLGVLFGALIIASLVNGMDMMSVGPENKYIARGVVLALAVWLDVKLAKP